MNPADLENTLASLIPQELAQDLVKSFLELRTDLATRTLGRASCGKFVETVVQVLQYLEKGKYDKKPKVDAFLRALENGPSSLDDGIRICLGRISRAMYSLRNKRNIAHKGEIDPNLYDLRWLFASAQWAMAELLRHARNVSMADAGRLIAFVQTPVSECIEDIDGKKLVLLNLSCSKEILILLHSVYPDAISRYNLYSSLDRRAEPTISKAIKGLWRDKLIEGDSTKGYKLTRLGYDKAMLILREILAGK